MTSRTHTLRRIPALALAVALVPGPASASPLFSARWLSFETASSAVALSYADMDADGRADYVLAHSSGNVSVVWGEGDGLANPKLTLTAGFAPKFVVTPDLNGDGRRDIAVANNGSGNVTVYLNLGGRAFGPRVDYEASSGTTGVAAEDLDGDGDVDLVTSNSLVVSSISILLNQGDGTFAAPVNPSTGPGPSSVAIGDVTGDHVPDVVTSAGAGTSISMLAGHGDGTFDPYVTIPVGNSPTFVRLADLDGDGRLDALVARAAADSVTIVRGLPGGGLARDTTLSAGDGPNFVFVGDANHDGVPDVLTTNGNGSSVSWFRGLGGRRYAPRVDLPVGTTPVSLVLSYLDGDAFRDLAVIHTGGSLRVLFGNGDGTFGQVREYTTGVAPEHVLLAPMNAGPTLDAVVANSSSNTVSVLPGDGAGGFGAKVDVGTSLGPASLALGDLDGDTDLDLVVANSSASSVSAISRFLNDGNGGLVSRLDYEMGISRAVVLGRWDANATLDVATADFGSVASLRPGTGTGTFGARTTATTGSGSSWLATGLLNADANPDLVVTNMSIDSVSVLPGNGAGGFGAQTRCRTGDGPICVAIGDANMDGIPDLVVANQYANSVSILRGNGNGTFQTKVDLVTSAAAGGGSPQFVAIADLDADGRNDLVVPNYVAKTVSVVRGNATPPDFGPVIEYGLPGNGTSVAIADVNGDTRLDLVVTNAGTNQLSVLLNRGRDHAVAVEPVVPVPPRPRLVLSPNPARTRFAVAFRAPAAGAVRLEVMDVAGRRVAMREVATPAGESRFELGAGLKLSPGVYVVRATQGPWIATGRVAIVR